MSCKKIFYLAGGTAALSYLYGFGQLACNTIFLDNYKEKLFNRFQNGFPIILSSKVKSSLKKILVKFDELDINKIDFFSVYGSEIQCLGIYQFGKSLIGIPWFFDYKSVDKINVQEITLFNDFAPNWKSADGKRILKSFIISDKAKNFAIAEAAFKNQSYYSLINLIIVPLSFTKGITIFLLNTRSNTLDYSKIKYRFVACTAFSFILTLFLKQLNEFYVEKHIRSQFIKNKDPIYFQGGVEYYTKQLQRNIALKNVLGKDGKRFFKENGEIKNYFWKKKSTLKDKIQFYSMNDKDIKVLK